MDGLKRFLKSSALFFIGSVLSRVIVFFLLPVYTRYIPSDAYGYYDLSVTYITIVTSILFLNIWSTVMRYMYDGNDKENKYKVIFSGSKIFAISTFLYVILGIILSITLSVQYLFLIFLYGILNNIVLMYTFISRGYEKNIEFVISGIINTFVMAVTNIIMIMLFHIDYSSLYIAAILGSICQIVYLELHIRIISTLHFRFYDSLLTKDMFFYSLPLCLNSISYYLLTSYNKVVISKVLSVSQNGLFAIGNKFSAVIVLVTTCFTYAWQETSFSRKIDDPTNGTFYSKACNLYLRFLCFGCILAIPIIKIIFPFMINESYIVTASLIPLSLITTIISSYSSFVGNIFYAIKNTKIIFISTVISCLVNLLLCNYLIKQFGLNGANLSLMLSFIVNIIIRDRILHRKMKFYTDIKQVLIFTLLLSITSEIYFKYNNLINVLWFILCILITGYSFQEYIVRILSVITQFIMKRRGYTTVADGINYNNEMKRFEMIELYKEKSNCCGCSACMNICPKKAITMKPDQDGYLFPDIKDDLCVKCGLCKRVCAFQKPLDKVNRDEPIATYAAINRDKSILSSSTSGGVFSALASIVFEKNGVVFGCAFDRNMEARHICIENPVNLKKLQGSKYVQSNIGTAYIKAKNFLQEGRWVLFTGTPCQIAGFKAYLGKDYPNLITADFVCHGVPSLSFFKGYIKYLEDTLNGKIINFKFRDKIYGWGVTGKVINQKNGTMNKKIILPITSYYFNYFLKGDISRESCYECKYACGIRSADFTMGDYWGIEKAHPDIKTKNGVSLLLINSEKGLQYINKLKQFMVLKQSTFKQAKEYNIQLNHPIEKSEKRDKILQLWREGGSRAVAEDYYKENKMQIKLALMKSMIPLPVRNTVKKYINKENAEKTKAYLYKKTLNHLRLTNKHGK